MTATLFFIEVEKSLKHTKLFMIQQINFKKNILHNLLSLSSSTFIPFVLTKGKLALKRSEIHHHGQNTPEIIIYFLLPHPYCFICIFPISRMQILLFDFDKLFAQETCNNIHQQTQIWKIGKVSLPKLMNIYLIVPGIYALHWGRCF